MSPAQPHRPSAFAFSLVEVVVVIVIMGIIAAIAIPRMSIAAARARVTSLRGDLAAMNRAIELYIVEHEGSHPAQDKSGAIDPDSAALITRLIERSDLFGDPGSAYGPYLLRVPTNPFNGLGSVRIDGAPAGAGTHGWRYDSTLLEIVADDSALTAAITSDSVAVKAIAVDAAGELKAIADDK